MGRPAPEAEPDPRIFAELGDLLFTVVNVARVVNVDPELALRATSERFVARVELAEPLAADERADLGRARARGAGGMVRRRRRSSTAPADPRLTVGPASAAWCSPARRAGREASLSP